MISSLTSNTAGRREYTVCSTLSELCVCVFKCVLLVYLQRLEEAKGAQTSAAGHQTEGGIVKHLLVVVPAETQQTVRGFSLDVFKRNMPTKSD